MRSLPDESVFPVAWEPEGFDMLDDERFALFFGKRLAVGHHEYGEHVVGIDVALVSFREPFVEGHLLQVVAPNATAGRTPEVVEVDDCERP